MTNPNNHNNRVKKHLEPKPPQRPPLSEVAIDSKTAMKYKIAGVPETGYVIIAFPGPVKQLVMSSLQAFRLHDILEEMTKHAANMGENVLPKEDTNWAIHVEPGSVADELVLVRDTLDETAKKLRALQDITDPILEVINCLPDPPSDEWGHGPVSRINYAIAAAGEMDSQVQELTSVGIAQAVESSAYHSYTTLSRTRTEAIQFLKNGESENALAVLQG